MSCKPGSHVRFPASPSLSDDVFSLLDIRKRNNRSHGKRKN